jgi:trk system potassium uptake protein TrkH
MNKTIQTTLVSSLIFQKVIGFGLFVIFLLSLYWRYLDPRQFVNETPLLILGVSAVSWGLVSIGYFLREIWQLPPEQPVTMRQSVFILSLTWSFAILTSSILYVLSGFPDPAGEFGLIRVWVDAIFESTSGFATVGSSILPSVEVFPRSILAWRIMTHFIGGMGIIYFFFTIFPRTLIKREEVQNSEAEGPNYIHYPEDGDVRRAGWKFLAVYGVLIFVLSCFLMISGALFRQTPYQYVQDNIFESVSYAVSTVATGGFAVHDTSVGLPLENGLKGGLQNPVSEWIIAIFMIFSAISFGIWYLLLFRPGLIRHIRHSTELFTYLGIMAGAIGVVFVTLWRSETYLTLEETARYAVFNIATIFTTTGLGNTNFHLWPAGATAILFLFYFVSGMTGSTTGGLKLTRYLILFRYSWMKLYNFVYGKFKTRFTIDGVRYDERQASLVVITVFFYFFLLIIGTIGILLVSPTAEFVDGTTRDVDLLSALLAALANLGNIGPTTSLGNVDSGPIGNYSAYNVGAKLILIVLMYIGRIGILTFLMHFISRRGMRNIDESVIEEDFDADEPILKG